MDLLERIQAQYESFNKTRKRISDYILAEPAKCCFLSLKEFSTEVAATETTVLSYCRALGLGSYVELKKELQTHMLTRLGPGDRFKMAARRSDSAEALYAQVVKGEREALRATFDQNGPERILAFIQCLRRAKKVFVAAHNASRLSARYFLRRMLPLGVDVYELDLQDKHQIFYRLNACPPEDCLVVAFAMSPYGGSTVAVTEYCREAGIGVVAVVDQAAAPVAAGAQVTLVCHTELMGLTNSSTPIMAVINLVSMMYSFELGAEDGSWRERLDRRRECFEGHFPDER